MTGGNNTELADAATAVSYIAKITDFNTRLTVFPNKPVRIVQSIPKHDENNAMYKTYLASPIPVVDPRRRSSQYIMLSGKIK